MHRWTCSGLCCVVAAFCCGSAQAELVDAVVATVGSEIILHSEVMDEIGPIIGEIQAAAPSSAAFENQVQEVFREALEQSIERKILYREAVLAGFQIPEEEVESRLERIIKQYDSRDAFMEMIEEAGETMSDFRERLRKQILAISMGLSKRRDFEAEAVVSESEMAQYYQDNLDTFSRPERVKLRRIFLPAGKEPGERRRVKARVEALRDQVATGGDFSDLAAQYSKGPAASDGGTIGWIVQGDLVDTLETAAFKLGADEMSEVLETEFGFTLLQAEAHEAPGTASFEEVRTDIEPALRADYADERYDKWIRELRKRSQVRVLI